MDDIEAQRNTARKVIGVFGGICMLAGLLVIVGTVSHYFLGQKSRYWHNTTGSIVSSEVEKFERTSSIGGSSRTSVTYAPSVVYSYSLQGKTYSNDRISFSPIGGSSRRSSQFHVSKYSVGDSITIYYDSKNPGNSTLEVGTSSLSIVAIFAGLAFSLFGLLIYKLRNFYANSIPG